jgi:hypothetical protein
MEILFRTFLCIAALASAFYCFKRAIETWALDLRLSENPSAERFFVIYFHWFWTVVRIAWALIWMSFAFCVLFAPSWAYWALAGLPLSLIVGLLVCWTYMPLALRSYKLRERI